MSIIGFFGICPKSKYEELEHRIKTGESAQAEELIREICGEAEASAAKLENGKCAGEVFSALFAYLQTAYGVNVRRGMEGVGAKWLAVTGDFDAVVFCEREQILALEGAMDPEGLSRFVSDFFQSDYGNTGQIAWQVLLSNLKSMGANDALVFRMI